MDENIFDKDSLDVIKPVDLKKTMETSYINYAMSVIASRATNLVCNDRIEQRTG